MEEAVIIGLVRAGATDVFSEIVEHYQTPIFRYVFRLTRDYELSKDILQDTFIQAYKGIIKTDSELSLKAWLYRIATNNVFKFSRRRKIISFIPLYKSDKSDIIPISEDPIISVSQNMAIEQTLLSVPREQRICLILHFVEGFKYEEIGEILGISEDAVRMRVTRGKQIFQRLYKRGDT